MQEPRFSDLDPDLLAELTKLESQRPEHRAVAVMTKMAEEITALRGQLAEGDKTQAEYALQSLKSLQSAGEALQGILAKPEYKPLDNSDKIVSGVSSELKKLELGIRRMIEAVKGIDVRPQVKTEVQAPQVNVEAPQVNVDAPDFSKMERLLDKQLPKLLNDLIKNIPVPELDNSEMEKRLQKAIDVLEEVRDRPIPLPNFPNKMQVTNPDGSTVGTTSGLGIPAHDYISQSTAATTDTFVYKSGGSGGTTVATVTITYTDSTKETISTIVKT